MILRTSRQLVRSMTSSATLTKKLKLSREAKKEIQKIEARSRKQDKKRALDDFPHYENTEISDYYFENGLRKVYPYHFVFKSYAKRRWLGRSICDVLLEEFNFPSQSIIPDRCLSGDLKVNDLPITPNYILQDSDLISHKVHRHELPVLNTPIKFVYEDDDVLVLSKPASIPVHPCGQYTLNSMVHILAKEYGRRPLRFIHRLDRQVFVMTSGLMITAKNYDASLRLTSQISAREVKKYYICQVEGHFPDRMPDASQTCAPGVITCDQPLGPICAKLGLHAVVSEKDGGKASLTHFLRLAYNPLTESSLVLCRLFTGRTHQIRVHLQYLGYPIVDDPLYNSTDWGEMKGKGAQYGIPLDEIIRRISNNRTSTSYLNENQPFTEPSHSFDRFKERISASSSLDSDTRDRLVRSFDHHCPDCRLCYRDPDIQHLILRLHAYRYCGLDWSYVAPLPDWATGGMMLPSQDLNALVEAGISTMD
ncbi:RNA pseudouridylate synthase domain-containing protein 2 [Paragonimus heterotremus]|uniref:Pseudouridine synthase n=1 Tax=Paragonimus heterotremus TaxID=100268 RepID=A0A8J4T023_9TREM|nr:RNA pseudouridylate synthase domain-containing protein 2 [Paragonimus heterotremus]